MHEKSYPANITEEFAEKSPNNQKIAVKSADKKCRAGSTVVLTQRLPAQRLSPSETSPQQSQKRQKGAEMPNRKRNHSICLKLTDEEYQLWNSKQTASGLSKTDYLMKALRSSTVKIYSIEDSVRPLVHEIRKIGTNLNQLAYFSNIGQDERVKSEIHAIRLENEKVMEQLSDFLKNPKFSIKEK